MNESKFEKKLIDYMSGDITHINEGSVIDDDPSEYVIKGRGWKYEPTIKTTEGLWENFKKILEQHNQNTLDYPLSPVEFNQVKKIISELQTPYQAGQFLYGLNGVSQIEIDLDDGRHVFLTVFDQSQIGAGDTVYQVVNQIERPAIITGKQDRRFDTTLLINGLPIIQIEEKRDGIDVNEALNQMKQYISEGQYHDIYSTLQILVAITPNNVKYMANTTIGQFNKDFAFNWQRQDDNKIVRNWREFADSMLSIPMAHQMATNYMILDGTKNKQMLKVMRPYQVYATQKVIEGLKKADFELNINKIGYVWHTTGSGKTITSFKTAWLASRMPNINKVVFVVDRIALTKQTSDNYKAYDPEATDDEDGSVQDTDNTTDLSRKLRSKDNNIVVTSVQKLSTLIKRKSFKAPKKHIVFIVDEAHRSTGGESFESIQHAFKHAAWVGYTGTPMFDQTTSGLRTEDIFGPLLHAYTIREAIVDRNVLGFKVDFETTINEDSMKEKYLPNFYHQRYPKWSDEKIQDRIANLSQDDMDDAVAPSFYDENPDHVREVVKDIFNNWRNRSNDGKYNALLTTHVGGGPSTPMAMMYFNEFQRVNELQRASGEQTLKVAVTFSQNSSNSDSMLATNEGLFSAISAYNAEFGTQFGMDDVSGYTQDVTARLTKSTDDDNFLDLVIVVDQLLTGFDAPELNTLYVDRTLKGAGLIQAYSRTNRIANMQEKPWGRVVNYRWPTQNEKLMNKALAIYANKDSAVLTDEERYRQNVQDGITAPEFKDTLKNVKKTVKDLSNLTDEFTQLPSSEKQKGNMLGLMHEYNAGMAKLKQYDPKPGSDKSEGGFNYDKPDDLIAALGMTVDQESMLTTVLTNELKSQMAKTKNVPIQQIELQMTHIKDVKIDYDYLTELVEQLLNETHEGKLAEARDTQGKINQFANGLDDRSYATKIINAADMIITGQFPPVEMNFPYPARLENSEAVIRDANNVSLDRTLLDFRINWGITDFISGSQMKNLFETHRYGKQDLNDTGKLQDVITAASVEYKTLAHSVDVQKLSKIKYRNELREAVYELADKLVKS
ncbi:type I restriction endonuclease subunit R [Furfurilactobacillus sp. WILCCON 0119]